MRPPSLQTRRLLLAVGALGLVSACVGLGVLIGGDFTLGRWFVLASSLILTPLFIYVLSLRGSARRTQRRLAEARKAELDTELAAFVTPDAIRATGDEGPGSSD